LTSNKLLTAGNVDLLVQLCALHGKLAAMWSDPETPPNAALLARYVHYHGVLGLLGFPTPKPKDPANRFARFDPANRPQTP
jgi:hypothetical protein